MSRCHLARLLPCAVALLLGLGCNEDLTQITGVWKASEAKWSDQAARLARSLDDLQGRLGALPANAAGREAADAALKACRSQLAHLEEILVNSRTAISEAARAGKVAVVEEAISANETTWTAASSRLAEACDGAGKLLVEVEERARLAAVAAAKAPDIADPAALKDGAAFDFSRLDFNPGKDSFSFARKESRETLDTLVEFGKRCPELLFELVGHTSREGAARANLRLSEQRAAAVKRYLIAHGIEAKKISRASGVGGGEPLVEEPEPDSKEAKAIEVAKLEEIRNRNRRITVLIVKGCP